MSEHTPGRERLIEVISSEPAQIAHALSSQPDALAALLASEPAAVADAVLAGWPAEDEAADLNSPEYLASVLAGARKKSG